MQRHRLRCAGNCKKAGFCKSKRGFSILVANRIDFVITNTGAGVLLISFFPPESFIPILVCLMFFCSMMGVSQTAGFSIVMASRRGQAGAASGIFGVMTFLFGSLTSPLMGIMGENSIIPLGVCLTGCALMAMLFMRLADKMKK